MKVGYGTDAQRHSNRLTQEAEFVNSELYQLFEGKALNGNFAVGVKRLKVGLHRRFTLGATNGHKTSRSGEPTRGALLRFGIVIGGERRGFLWRRRRPRHLTE